MQVKILSSDGKSFISVEIDESMPVLTVLSKLQHEGGAIEFLKTPTTSDARHFERIIDESQLLPRSLYFSSPPLLSSANADISSKVEDPWGLTGSNDKFTVNLKEAHFDIMGQINNCVDKFDIMKSYLNYHNKDFDENTLFTIEECPNGSFNVSGKGFGSRNHILLTQLLNMSPVSPKASSPYFA